MRRIAPVVLVLLAAAGVPRAQEDPEEHKRRMEEMERRIQELEDRLRKSREEHEALERRLDQARLDICVENLKSLAKLLVTYRKLHGGAKQAWPEARGFRFWTALTTTDPPILDEVTEDLMRCMGGGDDQPSRRFLGPARNANELKDADVLAACPPERHAGSRIAVLWKSGKVEIVETKDERHAAVLKGTESDQSDRCVRLLRELTQAAQGYELDHDRFPASGNAELVKALRGPSLKTVPYYDFAAKILNEAGEVIDPWGRPIIYRCGDVFQLYSCGANGVDDGGEGDDVRLPK